MDNQNLQNGNNGTEPKNGETRISLKDRIVSGYHKFRATKVGKWTVRIAKGGAVGGGLFMAYEAGKKSVKPTIVTIEHGTEEPVAEEETPVEEPAEEEKTAE